ncbi:MAG: alpha/beta fold hydrolase [Sarcina sp.]
MFFSKELVAREEEVYLNFQRKLADIKREKINTLYILGKAIFNREDSLEKLKEIDKLIYFAVGIEDQPRPPKESIEMSNLAKNSELFIIPNAGHISNLENPKVVNEILSKIYLQ